MATCRDTVTLALKKLGVIPAGVTPSAAEAADGLAALQGMLDGWCRDGLFGRLRDVHVTSDYTAREFQRIRVDGGTVTIPDLIDTSTDDDDYGFRPSCDPETPGDDDLPDPGHRPPRNRAVVITVDPSDESWATWLYEGDLGAWTDVSALTLDSQAPLSRVDADGLASSLALLIADQFGAQPQQATVAKAARFRALLSGRMDSTRRETPMQSF